MAQPARTTQRSFGIDPHAIRTLIGAQAGSVQKAMLEAVANSIDAGATAIDVKVTAKRIVLIDNGRGMDREGIEKHFEVFGFDHSKLDRGIGRFGVGRGQLFCFGKNTWRTGCFEMHVDIERSGLNYDLTEHPAHKHVPGMSIAIDLDSPLSQYDRHVLEEEFRKLVKYAIIPITYNDKACNTPPEGVKWDHDWPQAWVKTRATGDLLVYSQGLLVTTFANYRYGMGGEVVTKPGQALAQNMARNDILESKCPVWKSVHTQLGKLGKKHTDRAKATGTLSPEQRRTLAREALSEKGADALLDEPLFTLSNGRHVKVAQLLRRQVVSVAPPRSALADKLIQRNVAQVLDPDTLTRFGVTTPTELKDKLGTIIKRLMSSKHYPEHSMRHYELSRVRAQLRTTLFHDDIKTVSTKIDDSMEVMTDGKLPREQLLVLRALRRQNMVWSTLINRGLGLDREDPAWRQVRTIHAMKSETMDACTDGCREIWVSTRRLQEGVRDGLPGFMRLAGLMAHEMLHTDNSRAGHTHDHEFYEAYHDLFLDSGVAEVGMSSFASYVQSGGTPVRKHLMQLNDTMLDNDDPVVLGEMASDVELTTGDTDQATAAPTRKRRPK